MTTKLVYKGDLIENFGEFMPSPYIEQIRLYNETIEVDVSIFLTDREYGRTTEDTVDSVPGDPETGFADYGATPTSDMGKFLQAFNSSTQGREIGAPGSPSTIDRKLHIYLGWETCVEEHQCKHPSKGPFPWHMMMDKILDPNRKNPLYDYLIRYGPTVPGITPTANTYIGKPFSDFTESDDLLFAEDGTRIVKYFSTYEFENPIIELMEGSDPEATSTSKLKFQGEDVMTVGTTGYTSTGDATVDPATGVGSGVLWGFSSYIDILGFEEMYGTGDRYLEYSSTAENNTNGWAHPMSADSHDRADAAMFPLYELARGQFSDVVYEDVLKASGTANYGTIVEFITTWVDNDNEVYPRAPIRDLGGRYRKIGELTPEGIKEQFEGMIEEFKARTTLDEASQNGLDEIATIINTYSSEGKAEIPGTEDDELAGAPAVLVLEKLGTLRAMWPHKAQGTRSGQLYRMLKNLLANINATVSREDAVRRRRQRNLKIFDLRHTFGEASYDPGISSYGDYDTSSYNPIYRRSISDTMMKVDVTEDGASMGEKDILEKEFSPAYESWTTEFSTDDFKYTVMRRGWWFFDFEMALYIHSVINKTFHLQRLENWFGKSMIQSRYLVEKASLRKFKAYADDPTDSEEDIRQWDVWLYRDDGEYNNAPSQIWPYDCDTTPMADITGVEGLPYSDRYQANLAKKRQSYFDQDEAHWLAHTGWYYGENGPPDGIVRTYWNAPGDASGANFTGVKNNITPNRIKPSTDSRHYYVATPPLPLPKRIQVDNFGHDANMPAVPNGSNRGVFPGAFNAENDLGYKYTAAMYPRNFAAVGADFYDGEYDKPAGISYMLAAKNTEYDTTTDVFSPVYNYSPRSDGEPEGTHNGTVSPSIYPYGYRLMTFEFIDLYKGENVDWMAIEHGDHDEYTMQFYADVDIRDYTGNLAISIMDSYLDIIEGGFESYVEYATEWCAYNKVEDSFTAYFADAITEWYTSSARPEWTPWLRAPMIYYMHRDLLFGEFGGGTVQAKTNVIASAINMAEKISPYTGNLTSLLAFQEEMMDFYSEYYGEGGTVRTRVEALMGGSSYNSHSWSKRLLFHNGDSNTGVMDTTDDNSVPRPLDVTQQQDVENFSEWDVTIEEFIYDEICNDGYPMSSADDPGGYLVQCTIHGIIPAEGSDETISTSDAFETVDPATGTGYTYFYPGIGLSGHETTVGTTTIFESDSMNAHDFSSTRGAARTMVGPRTRTYLTSDWESCKCYCPVWDTEDDLDGSTPNAYDGGWVNVVAIRCPSTRAYGDVDPDGDTSFTEEMWDRFGQMVKQSDGSSISGPAGTCWLLAAWDGTGDGSGTLIEGDLGGSYVDSPEPWEGDGPSPYVDMPGGTGGGGSLSMGEDLSPYVGYRVNINEGFLDHIMEVYPGIKPVRGISMGTVGGTGPYRNMMKKIYNQLTRPPTGTGVPGDSGENAKGFCVQCMGEHVDEEGAPTGIKSTWKANGAKTDAGAEDGFYAPDWRCSNEVIPGFEDPPGGGGTTDCCGGCIDGEECDEDTCVCVSGEEDRDDGDFDPDLEDPPEYAGLE